MLNEYLIETLKHVWNALQPLDVSMALMGGVAVATWLHKLGLSAELAQVWDEAFPGESP